MAINKPVLGRGLASLIPREQTQTPQGMRQDDGTAASAVTMIDIDRIERNPYQPRAEFDPVALDELKNSIREKGVIQPITVRRTDHGYQLISGERRVRAAREAGLRWIPAFFLKVESNADMLELALIENLQREDLNPMEIAVSYRRLIEECGLTQEQVSQKVGKERSTVTNLLRLLRLPDEIQTAVRKGTISSGHARALLGVEDHDRQMEIFEKIVEKDLSVRGVERLARDLAHPGKSGEGTRKPLAIGGGSALTSIEERLRQALGTKVTVKPGQGGRGEIVVEYYSSDDFERIVELLSTERE